VRLSFFFSFPSESCGRSPSVLYLFPALTRSPNCFRSSIFEFRQSNLSTFILQHAATPLGFRQIVIRTQVGSKPKYAKMNCCFGWHFLQYFVNDPGYLAHANGGLAMHPHEFHSDVGCTGLGNCSGHNSLKAHCHSLGDERAALGRTGDQTSALDTGLGTDHCPTKTTTPHVAGLASIHWTGNGWMAASLTVRGCLYDGGSARYGLKTTLRL